MLFRFKPEFPVIEIDSNANSTCCPKRKSCQNRIKEININLGKYVTTGNPFRKQVVTAILSVPLSLDDYVRQMRKVHKGNALREVKKADKKEYKCGLFQLQNHIVDFVEINQSKEIRQGRKMTKSYHKNINDYGGLPDKILQIKHSECPLHFSQWMGIFKPIEGYKQGTLLVGKKLVGYINLIRHGEIILYSSILGHGDYLNDGIMYLLNHKTVEWVIKLETLEEKRLKHIMYAGYFDGTDGLQKWKKRTLFEPFYLRMLA